MTPSCAAAHSPLSKARSAYLAPAEFDKLVTDEIERWRKLITSGGIAQD
jgi:tripartite-type tricarboxylate transporter receptor subunit TctC